MSIAKERQSTVRRLVGVVVAAGGLLAVIELFNSFSTSKAAREQLWTLNSLHLSEFEDKLDARPPTNWYVGIGPGELQPEAAAPTMHPTSGFFEREVEVVVEAADAEDTVRCSYDGRVPTAEDEPYSEPVTLSESTVVRCRSFRAGHQPSTASTSTYMVDAVGRLPVVSIAIEPSHLWNPYAGIYVHYNERGRQWERHAVLEYLPRDGDDRLAFDGRLRIHGNFSRSRPKKSLRFYYAAPEQSADAGNVLTWASASGQRTVVLSASDLEVSRDELFRRVMTSAGGLTAGSMPAAVYINGEPWGVYFVRERIDSDYLLRHFGEGEYDLLAGEPGEPSAVTGDRGHWRQTVRFFESRDFATPEALEEAGDWVDLDNLTDFWLFNIYTANFDWPHHNFYVFRNRTGDGRWRWISWDADATFDFQGFGLEHDTLAWATRATLRHDLRYNHEAGLRDNDAMRAPALIVRKLLENPDYRQRFAGRLYELLETVFSPESLNQELDLLYSELADDLPVDFSKWSDGGLEAGRDAYIRDLDRVRHFIRARPAIVREHFSARFDSADAR